MRKISQYFVFVVVLFNLIVLEAQQAWADIPLEIVEIQGIARVDEMVHNGIPVSKTDNITSTDSLIIEDANGTQIPATFEVLSRWAGGIGDTSQPIQWLLISFPASVTANSSASYFLRTGTPVAKTTQVSVTENTTTYTIDTGAAEFVINKNSLSLFDSISNSSALLASGNGGSHSTIDGQSEAAANAPLAIEIERQNDHYVVIKVEGDYGNTPIGASPNQAPISYKIRYEFFAGSPTAIVSHKFFWAGSGDDDSAGRPATDYFFRMDNVSLSLPNMAAYTSADVYADQTTYLTGSSAQSASIAQRRKEMYADPHLAEIANGFASSSTEFASRPMLINRSGNGAIAVSIDHMMYFEPQSITTTSAGKITVNVLAEEQYLSDYQGAWARIGISALPTDTGYDDTVRLNYAPLNYRLLAFPSNDYTASTRVYNELPLTSDSSCDGTVSVETSAEQKVQCYYDELREVTDATLSYLVDEDKNDYRGITDFRGLMTWGSMAGYADNMGSLNSWDRIYTGAWNTDYHNAWHNVNYQFALEGDPTFLYDLTFMAARRMLHTQIIQPDWENSTLFMGWGYTGYHRYRSNGISSHSFFENLFNYYYMTGDMEVLDIIRAGGENRRDLYTRDGDALNDIITYDRPAEHQGRISSQTIRIFNFMGHTDTVVANESDSQSFFQDYHHMFKHIFARCMFLQQSSDPAVPEYAFLGDDIMSPDTFVSGTEAEQNWMIAIYTMNDLYRYYDEWNDPVVINLRNDVDSSLNNRDLSVSEVYQALTNSFMRYVPNACVEGTVCYGQEGDGNGEWEGLWPNKFQVNFTGHRLSGAISSVVPVTDGDSQLFDPGKTLITLIFLRAGKLFEDTFDFEGDGIDENDSYTDFGFKGLDWALMNDDFYDAEDQLWAKENGEEFCNLHGAISYLQSLQITTTSLSNATEATAYSAQLQAAQGTEPYVWTVISGNLPAGLSLSDGGTVSGSPTATGTFQFTIQVTDADNDTDSCLLNITVYSNELTITTPSLPDAEAGISYSQTLNRLNGTAPFAWSVLSGSLPTGLTLSDIGVISGTPASQGTFSFTVQISDAEENTANAELSITVGAPLPHELNIRVSQGSDDAEEAVTGSVYLASDLEIGQDNGYDQAVGIRFTNLDIPSGVTISNAYIQFTTEEIVNTDPISITVHGENVGNAQTFTEETENISSREVTTASVNWSDIAAWNTLDESGVNQRTPDLSDIIQEIIDREDWAAENALAFIISGTGTRTAYSYDVNPGSAPLLHIEYYSGGITPPTCQADFSSNTTSATTGQAVQFTDLSTGNPASWSWNFGDGSAVSTQQSPEHTYQTAGTYTVSLTVSNADGSSTETKSSYITVTQGDTGGSGGGSSGCFIQSI